MPFLCYEAKKFSASSRFVIDQANAIIREYASQGYSLTLRQLYYQFVARALVPNTMRSYKRLGSIVNDARMAGLIDWNAIEDRTRNLQQNPHWSDPGDIVRACADQFKLDLWSGQSFRPEVWIEKEALVGVIARTCADLDVPYFACRGYVSQSEQWRAGMRHAHHRKLGQTPIVLHLGDHDPSGIDMTRDNSDRLFTFVGADVPVRRLALNMDQVEEHRPPPNPAKVTDSRFEGYVARYGEDSWELDALEPALISSLVRDAIKGLIDPDDWREASARQARMREELGRVADDWDAVVENLS